MLTFASRVCAGLAPEERRRSISSAPPPSCRDNSVSSAQQPEVEQVALATDEDGLTEEQVAYKHLVESMSERALVYLERMQATEFPYQHLVAAAPPKPGSTGADGMTLRQRHAIRRRKMQRSASTESLQGRMSSLGVIATGTPLPDPYFPSCFLPHHAHQPRPACRSTALTVQLPADALDLPR